MHIATRFTAVACMPLAYNTIPQTGSLTKEPQTGVYGF